MNKKGTQHLTTYATVQFGSGHWEAGGVVIETVELPEENKGPQLALYDANVGEIAVVQLSPRLLSALLPVLTALALDTENNEDGSSSLRA